MARILQLGDMSSPLVGTTGRNLLTSSFVIKSHDGKVGSKHLHGEEQLRENTTAMVSKSTQKQRKLLRRVYPMVAKAESSLHLSS